MTPTEILHLVWTICTGLGTLVMIVLLREVWLDAWAISQVRHSGTDVLRLLTLGEVHDQSVRLLAIATLFAAGVLSYLGPDYSPVVIGLICTSTLAQIWIGVVRLSRRRRVLHVIKINHGKM